MKRIVWLVLFLATDLVLADEVPKAKPEAAGDAKEVSGMSVLGTQEAPKALVIVPWKSSEIGASLGVRTLLDDSKQPIDKDVFMRALSYYEIRSNPTRHDGAAEQTDAARPAPAAHRRSS